MFLGLRKRTAGELRKSSLNLRSIGGFAANPGAPTWFPSMSIMGGWFPGSV